MLNRKILFFVYCASNFEGRPFVVTPLSFYQYHFCSQFLSQARSLISSIESSNSYFAAFFKSENANDTIFLSENSQFCLPATYPTSRDRQK